MTGPSVKTSLVREFLEELAKSLDLDVAARKVGIDRAEVRSIIESLIKCLPAEDDRVVVYIDGAARGNPGPAGVGIVVKDSAGRILKKAKKRIGSTTNNVAEYTALIEALKLARSMGKSSVEVFSDSELLVRQINGQYAVRAQALKPLYARAMDYISGFSSFSITHISREDNTLADSLANEAIDGI